VIPKEFKAAISGEADFAPYSKLCDLLFTEPNPTPCKFALKEMGIISDNEMRLPLLKVSEGLGKDVLTELKRLKVL
jgi:dihydrodipicolinate synthase/N-acetylneuraminate lyase